MTPKRRNHSWLQFMAGLAIGFLLVAPVLATPLDLPAVFGAGDSSAMIVIAAAMTMVVIILLEVALTLQSRRLRTQRIKRHERLPRR
jgi:hypothetical protein